MSIRQKLFLILLTILVSVALLVSCGDEPEETTTLSDATSSHSDPDPDPDPETEKRFLLENQVLSVDIAYQNGSIALTSLYNKQAKRDYLTEHGRLFSYTLGDYDNQSALNQRTVTSDSGKLKLVSSREYDITFHRTSTETVKVGKTTEIVLKDEEAGLGITLLFEIYDGNAGIRYQAILENLTDKKIVITESDVISLALLNETHKLHYISAAANRQNPNIATDSSWKSTSGALSKNTGRNALCVYESGDGWWIMPETNWRTQLGPDQYGTKPNDTSATYEFATTSCFSSDQTVKVTTNPDSLMLTLKPGEAFEYIGVNFTVFKGDVIDGKMAAEEHFYKRFRYHDTSTIINTNDWYYLDKRTTKYFKEVLIPAAKAAGIDMVMLDDLWNMNRDSITAISALGSLDSFSQLVKDNGFLLGLWYSMSGGDHNNGRDLADPSTLAEKIALVEKLIKSGMNHMMVDLTEYWQNTEETDYSSPCDNVYRKNVMVQNALNLLIEKYPEFYVKPTNEVDVFPTQGNRSNGLLHVMNNGWVVGNGGLGNHMPGLANMFGYLPLSATYGDGDVDGNIAEYYYYLFCRNVKLPYAPDTDSWTEKGIALMAMLNAWRNAERVKALTDTVKRPSYLGEGWKSDNQSDWSKNGLQNGPYAWTYVNDEKTRALLIATAEQGEKKDFIADLRWLDADKTYLVADVSLSDRGYFNYSFIGAYTGSELVQNGFAVKLQSENVGGKAFWFEAIESDKLSVVYASEAALTYTLTQNGKTYTVSVSGEKGEVATVILGERSGKKGLVLSIIIGENGTGSATFTENDLKAPEQTGLTLVLPDSFSDTGRLEFEDLYADGKLGFSDPSISFDAKPDDVTSVGASNNDYRKVFFPKGAGSYITIPVTVSKTGEYLVSVTMKANENQAKTALGLNGTVLSETVDFSSGYTLNRMHTLSCVMELKAGVNEIYVFAMGKGAKNNSNTLSLRIDCLDYKPLTDNGYTVEAETIPAIGTVVDSSAASDGKLVILSSNAIGAYTDIPLSLKRGRYEITLSFMADASSPIVAIIHNGEGVGETYDLYEKTATLKEIVLTVDVESEADTLRILTIGKKNASDGYTVRLDRISCQGRVLLAPKSFGITLKKNETVELSELFFHQNELVFMLQGETAFGVLTQNKTVATAQKPGSAIITAWDPFTNETASVVITVTDESIASPTLAVINTVNEGSYAEAKAMYDSLPSDQKALVTNFVLLKKSGSDTLHEGENKNSGYLDELDYGFNKGSTVKEGTCPSGSHKLQFIENGTIYQHGIGFEPTADATGSLYVRIPENATRFTVMVGIDSEMSKANYAYDQQNTVSVFVDGKEAGKTERILKNMQNGTWVDHTYTLEIQLPENAEYLVIVNYAGANRTCDHILYADPCFS